MIACDCCGEWYHFSCINLPEPDSSDEDTDDVIQQECELSGDFICPQCKELSSKRDNQVTGAGSMKAEYRFGPHLIPAGRSECSECSECVAIALLVSCGSFIFYLCVRVLKIMWHVAPDFLSAIHVRDQSSYEMCP